MQATLDTAVETTSAPTSRALGSRWGTPATAQTRWPLTVRRMQRTASACWTSSVGLGALSFSSPSLLAVGETIQVTLHVPGQADLMAMAQVTKCRSQGIGFDVSACFVRLTPAIHKALTVLVCPSSSER